MNTNIQDKILNVARRDKIDLVIYLTNGVPVSGRVIAFDNFTILLKNDVKQNLIYKHAVSTVVPSKIIKIDEE